MKANADGLHAANGVPDGTRRSKASGGGPEGVAAVFSETPVPPLHFGGEAPRFPSQAVWCALPQAITPQRVGASRSSPPPDGDWLYEIRLDGHRMLARIDAGEVRLITGDGEDWTARLQPLRRTLAAMRLLPGWYDGEVVVLDERGLPDADALRQALHRRTGDVVLYLFDLPYLDNYDLRAAPLAARRALLARLLAGAASDRVRLSEAFPAPAQSLLATVCRLGLEGLVAKRKDAPYRAGRQADWVRIDCGPR